MRTEQHVIKSIIHFAEIRQDIPYVIQNGSRVNPNITIDQYADFDIIFGCQACSKYVENQYWIHEFGTVLILQVNECEEHGLRWPIFLLQFTDGVRIDVQFYPGDGMEKYHCDSLSTILLDKHGIFCEVFEPSEATYITRKPSRQEYCEVMNEFWWCIINVGKGIARHELTYATFMYESIVRECFLTMMAWYVSAQHNWRINTGKFGKFLEKYADADVWHQITLTYTSEMSHDFWDALFQACFLIQRVDTELRPVLGISENGENSDGIIAFLEKIRDDDIEKSWTHQSRNDKVHLGRKPPQR